MVALRTDTHYKIEGHGGIAWYFDGMQTEEVYVEIFDDSDEYNVIDYEDTEERETGLAYFVMVGDDKRWVFDPELATEIDEDQFCGECGQIGCGWG